MTLATLTAGDKQVRLELADPADHISGIILQYEEWYERDLLKDIRSVARRGTAVDVGAHIGNHTVWMAAACGLNVVALEPNEASRAQLARNVDLNGLSQQVRIIPAAAGKTAGKGRIESPNGTNTGMARTIPDPAGDVDIIAIDSLALDDVAVVKVDAEGAELEVLAGAVETLRRCKPILYVEAVDTLSQVEALLRPLGYRRTGRFAKTPTYRFVAGAPARVSVAIMAHPKRSHFIPELQRRLDRPAELVMDRRNDRWDTGRRAMLAFEPSSSHHLVIQDDAIPARDLTAGIERALRYVPGDTPLCLYVGRVRPFRGLVQQLVESAGRNTSWLTMSQLHWGPGIVMPTHMIEDMVAWCDNSTNVPNYDRRISRWIQHKGLTVWYPWPSLVDHRSVRENPSLVPGRTGNRRAHWFLGADISALDCRWDGRVVTIPALSGADVASSGQVGAAVKFVSEKYPDLHIPTIGVRFRDGVAEATTRGAIAHLSSPWMRRRGVRVATDADLRAASRAPEPAAAVPPSTSTTQPAPAPAAEPAPALEAAQPEPGPAREAVAPPAAGSEDDAAKQDRDNAGVSTVVPLGGGWWGLVVDGEQVEKVRGEQAARQRLAALTGTQQEPMEAA